MDKKNNILFGIQKKRKAKFLLDKQYPSKLNEDKALNKSGSTKDLSIYKYKCSKSLSQNKKKNEIILLEEKNIKKSSNHPIFLSFMMNKKNFAYSSEKNLKIRNYQDKNKNNNILIKSNSTNNIHQPIILEPFNSNHINRVIIKKNENVKLINNKKETINNFGKFTLNTSILKKILKNNLNINQIRNVNVFNINKRYLNKNKKQNQNTILLKNTSTFNSNITNNTSDNLNYSIIPNANISQNQKMLSTIHIPLQNTTNISTINNITKEINQVINNSSLQINEYIAKDTKDKNIKKILMISKKENENGKVLINKKSFKLKDFHNFPTVLVEEGQNKNKDIKNNISYLYNSYSKRRINFKNMNKQFENDRIIKPYIFKNKNINSSENLINNRDEIKKELNIKEKNVNIKDNKIDKNQKVKRIINEKKINLIEGKIKKKARKKVNKNKTKERNKFLYIFNTNKLGKIYGHNKFLKFIYSDISKKNEFLINKEKEDKIPIIIKRTKEIKKIILNEEKNLKEYINNINGSLNNLKNGIFITEKKIKIKEKYNNLINQIFFYKFTSLYILPFKKINLSYIFNNYLFKSKSFSTIYLPFINLKNSNKRHALISRKSLFAFELSNSLYPDIKSIFIKEEPEKFKLFISNIDLIIRLINKDIDDSKNDVDIKNIINKINKPLKANKITNLINKKKNYTNRNRNTVKNYMDLSFMPQFDNSGQRNNTYKLMFQENKNSHNNNYYFKKDFPHSLLEEKPFFEVPKRSFNIKLNSAISNAILYNKICDKKIEEIKKDNNKIVKDIMEDEIQYEDIINKKCIEKLKIAINRCKTIKGRKNIIDNYKILNEIKGKKHMEETLRVLINEREENLFLDYLEKIYRRIDLNCKDENNNTLLILSVKEGLINIIKELLEKNVEINFRNKQGNTALHIALGNKMFYIADLLKKYGADESILNKNGQSPWECVTKS